MSVTTIISGGQTGADTGGLFAGKALGLATGGYAPKNYRTEKGSSPWLADYGLMEHESGDYPPRTEDNVRLSDGTIIFGQRSPGSNKTEEFCRLQGKPCLWVNDYSISLKNKMLIRAWLKVNKIQVLNVAGNRESRCPGIQQGVAKLITAVLTGYTA